MSGPSRAEWALRVDVVTTARAMNASGLNRGTSGNVSTRLALDGFDGFLVTPSGMAYERIGPADVVALDTHGSPRDADAPVPSSEWRFHGAIYAARPEANAIVHTHSVFATALACHGLNIPPFHYMIAMAGGHDVRCAPYARFGTHELADAVLTALAGRTACLMANHGMVAIGPDLDRALALAREIETLAETYWRARQIGEPMLLSSAEMTAVIDRFAHYGQR
ncbi:MAG: class II aldolase/adducin family protein [Casimicrobiaceae bacterium]